jgi:hypothetical protein
MMGCVHASCTILFVVKQQSRQTICALVLLEAAQLDASRHLLAS